MYIKHDNVRIKRIILDLRDVIADSKKVVLFEQPKVIEKAVFVSIMTWQQARWHALFTRCYYLVAWVAWVRICRTLGHFVWFLFLS